MPNLSSILARNLKNDAEKTSAPSLFPTNAPTRLPSNSPQVNIRQTDQERKREREIWASRSFLKIYSQTPPYTTIFPLWTFYLPLPLQYINQRRNDFDLIPLLLHNLPTADILFLKIPSPSDPSSAQNKQIAIEFPVTDQTRQQSHNFALVLYSCRHTNNPSKHPTLSPQYLYPPNGIIFCPHAPSQPLSIPPLSKNIPPPPNLLQISTAITWWRKLILLLVV